MRRRLSIFLLAVIAALACARPMVKAPAPPPGPEGPVQGPAAAPAPAPAPASAPAGAPAPSLELDDRIPLDPGIVTGRLDNGLTYFVRSNTEP
ncbi:MAG: hypothetical protein ACE5EG_11950, partial [Thermoanaerobaculia bacterium]